jgi:hypothetical protein
MDHDRPGMTRLHCLLFPLEFLAGELVSLENLTAQFFALLWLLFAVGSLVLEVETDGEVEI